REVRPRPWPELLRLRARLGELDALDRRRLARLVVRVPRKVCDAVDDVHPVRDSTEDGVLAVEPRARLGGDDEELAAVRVRPGVRHRERPTLDLVVVDLVLERVARPTRPVSCMVAALDHEFWYQ